MNQLSYIVVFSLVGGVFSLVGALVLLSYRRLTERILIHLVTFSAGTLLGASFLNILPEAFHQLQPGQRVEPLFAAVLAGTIVFFILERILLRFHHHEGEHTRLAPLLLLLGDAIHNFLDGVAIAISFFISVPVGIVTALAVAAHEVPSEIGEFSVMLQAGWQRAKVLLTNVAVAMTTTLGALLVYLNREAIESVTAWLLAFTAGLFIYISLSDLVPEIHQKTRKDKAWHVIVLLVSGVVAVGAVAQLAERLIK